MWRRERIVVARAPRCSSTDLIVEQLGREKVQRRLQLRLIDVERRPGAVEAARAECRTLAARLVSALDGADVLVIPTLPCVAPTHEEAARRSEGSPRRPIGIKLTRIPGPVNVAGLAALSAPCGVGTGGLPIGLQLIGRDEETVLTMGMAYEREGPEISRCGRKSLL